MQEQYLGRFAPDMDVCDRDGDRIGKVARIYRDEFATAVAAVATATDDTGDQRWHAYPAAAEYLVAFGRRTVTVVPTPGWLSTSIVPACRLTMPWQTARPMPLPSPTGRVVKNGSKMSGRCSGAIPTPPSEMPTATLSPSSWTLTRMAAEHSLT